MSFAIRRKVMLTLVAMLGLWPMAHYYVVAAYDLNPWNWFGWAMYTQPSARIEATPYSLSGERVSPAAIGTEKYREIQELYLDWSARYMQVDAREAPDAFARAILEAHPHWKGVNIRVEKIGLDRKSAKMAVFDSETHLYFRRSVGLE